MTPRPSQPLRSFRTLTPPPPAPAPVLPCLDFHIDLLAAVLKTNLTLESHGGSPFPQAAQPIKGHATAAGTLAYQTKYKRSPDHFTLVEVPAAAGTGPVSASTPKPKPKPDAKAAASATTSTIVMETLYLSSVGLGSHKGSPTELTSQQLATAATSALAGGVNVLDTSINYLGQYAEKAIGSALARAITTDKVVTREQVFVATKVGFLPSDASIGWSALDVGESWVREWNMASRMNQAHKHLKRNVEKLAAAQASDKAAANEGKLGEEQKKQQGKGENTAAAAAAAAAAVAAAASFPTSEVVSRNHCIAPACIDMSLRASLRNLGLETLDLVYIHNLEAQLLGTCRVPVPVPVPVLGAGCWVPCLTPYCTNPLPPPFRRRPYTRRGAWPPLASFQAPGRVPPARPNSFLWHLYLGWVADSMGWCSTHFPPRCVLCAVCCVGWDAMGWGRNIVYDALCGRCLPRPLTPFLSLHPLPFSYRHRRHCHRSRRQSTWLPFRAAATLSRASRSSD